MRYTFLLLAVKRDEFLENLEKKFISKKNFKKIIWLAADSYKNLIHFRIQRL